MHGLVHRKKIVLGHKLSQTQHNGCGCLLQVWAYEWRQPSMALLWCPFLTIRRSLGDSVKITNSRALAPSCTWSRQASNEFCTIRPTTTPRPPKAASRRLKTLSCRMAGLGFLVKPKPPAKSPKPQWLQPTTNAYINKCFQLLKTPCHIMSYLILGLVAWSQLASLISTLEIPPAAISPWPPVLKKTRVVGDLHRLAFC